MVSEPEPGSMCQRGRWAPLGGWIVKSHIGWGGERSMPYKGPTKKELKARGINNEHTLAYQSRVGPVQWLKPYTDETLVELGQKSVRSLLAVLSKRHSSSLYLSFVSEHIVTLEEIDIEYRKLALESGIKYWACVPALGLSPSFITDLADAVIEDLPSAKAMYASTSTSEEEHDPLRVHRIKETRLIFQDP
ncbi:hypothetical protein Ahy_B05g075576 [Arachis hypogaea]|uniref:Ferrochelatase n=1 Tax=Arachis hypogaea TaxID=3818 RepID=A0A444Z1U6_ARAHY|nr:hypothetical protein Ahy_B05g075576 [Arachis hypogaea]